MGPSIALWPLRQLWRDDFEALASLAKNFVAISGNGPRELHALSLLLLVLRRLPLVTTGVRGRIALISEAEDRRSAVSVEVEFSDEEIVFSRLHLRGTATAGWVAANAYGLASGSHAWHFSLTRNERPPSIQGLCWWIELATIIARDGEVVGTHGYGEPDNPEDWDAEGSEEAWSTLDF